MSNQTVLITGAASGFGREFAKIFAKEGYSLVLVDKAERGLRETVQMIQQNGNAVTTLVKDLGQMNAGHELYHEIKAQGKQIDILINNAGFGQQGDFVENDWQRESDIIHTNVVTFTELTKLCLRDMLRRDEGKILQVGSIAGYLPAPHMAVYSASKAYVNHFTRALQEELEDTNITVTLLAPGASDTNFFAEADGEDMRIVQDSKLTPADQVAQAGYDALMKGKPVEIVGMKNEMMVKMANVMPASWTTSMMGKLHEDKHESETERQRQR
ncbi:MAG: SDR family NAD(P)-dependent oxidoreductase [Saprospiraceae bacterium]